jgi:hypothetical protein
MNEKLRIWFRVHATHLYHRIYMIYFYAIYLLPGPSVTPAADGPFICAYYAPTQKCITIVTNDGRYDAVQGITNSGGQRVDERGKIGITAH